MEKEDMVLASEFCVYHNIEVSFIHSLRVYDMIETVLREQEVYLPVSQLPRLEKIVRLHFELDINLEGIETITYLLEKMNLMQNKMTQLANRLKEYEG
jgi:chaperone modulatory protein CbpM